MTAGRKVATLSLVAAAAMILAGCAADDPTKPTNYIGQTLEVAMQHLNAPN